MLGDIIDLYFVRVIDICGVNDVLDKQPINIQREFYTCTGKDPKDNIEDWYAVNMVNSGDSITNMMSDLNKFNLHKFEEIYNNLRNFIYHLLKGLQELHNRNIVNKDIKLDNITLQNIIIPDNNLQEYNPSTTPQSLCKYIDFGLSIFLDTKINEIIKVIDEMKNNNYDNSNIIFNSLLSTPSYLPPEVFSFLVFLNSLDKINLSNNIKDIIISNNNTYDKIINIIKPFFLG